MSAASALALTVSTVTDVNAVIPTVVETVVACVQVCVSVLYRCKRIHCEC